MTSPLTFSPQVFPISGFNVTQEELESCKKQLQITALSLKKKYLSLALSKKIEVCIQLLNCVAQVDEGFDSVESISGVLVYKKKDEIGFLKHRGPPGVEQDARWIEPQVIWLAHQTWSLQEKKDQLRKWCDLNKSNVWGCAKAIACLLRPGIYRLLSPHRMDPEKERQWYVGCYEKGFVPGMELVGAFDPLCKLLKEMLAPRPQDRPSLQECLSRLERIR